MNYPYIINYIAQVKTFCKSFHGGCGNFIIVIMRLSLIILFLLGGCK